MFCTSTKYNIKGVKDTNLEINFQAKTNQGEVAPRVDHASVKVVQSWVIVHKEANFDLHIWPYHYFREVSKSSPIMDQGACSYICIINGILSSIISRQILGIFINASQGSRFGPFICQPSLEYEIYSLMQLCVRNELAQQFQSLLSV